MKRLNELREEIELEMLMRRVGHLHRRHVFLSRLAHVAFYGIFATAAMIIWFGWWMLVSVIGCLTVWLSGGILAKVYYQVMSEEIDEAKMARQHKANEAVN